MASNLDIELSWLHYGLMAQVHDPQIGKFDISELNDAVTRCRRCPRLVEWREQAATDKRAAFRDQDYWGRPVPSFGPGDARVLVVGLAPAAHGANRTGRMFTGDRSGDWLYRAMWRAGLASQPDSTSAGDGLELVNARITSIVRCAPPDNKPTVDERDRCLPYLRRELELIEDLRVIVCLGAYAWENSARQLGIRPRPKFAHGLEHAVGDLTVVCSYHPSQRNTFTGLLTENMLAEIFQRAAELAS